MVRWGAADNGGSLLAHGAVPALCQPHAHGDALGRAAQSLQLAEGPGDTLLFSLQ